MTRKLKQAWISESAHKAFKSKAAISGKSFVDVVEEAATNNSKQEKKKLENWKIF